MLDKLGVVQALSRAGVRCITTLYSTTEAGKILSPADEDVSAEVAAEDIKARGGKVFIKPVEGGTGDGAFSVAAAAVDADLLAKHPGVIIQPVLENHPVLAALFPGCLNTIRIDTLVEGDTCTINAACLKVGTGTTQVDNWAKGSIAIGVDLESGALTSTGVKKAVYGRTIHAVHPDTGATFEGVTMPYWQETLDTARRAGLALRPHIAIGWDIAITPDGPVAIEPNPTGDVFLLQEACGPLGKTRLAEVALEHWRGRKAAQPPAQRLARA